MGKGRGGCKGSPLPWCSCVDGQWASSGCGMEKRGAPSAAQHPASWRGTGMVSLEMTMGGCLDASEDIMTSTKCLTFPLWLCRLLCPWLVWKSCALEVGAGRLPSAAGRLSRVTTCDFQSQFPTHAAPAAFFTPQQAHHEPDLELATRQHPNVSLNLGTRGVPTTHWWVWKDAVLARRILPPHCKGGTRSTLWQLPKRWLTSYLGYRVLYPVMGRASEQCVLRATYVFGFWLVLNTKNAACACLCRGCETMCLFCLPWGNPSSPSIPFPGHWDSQHSLLASSWCTCSKPGSIKGHEE